MRADRAALRAKLGHDRTVVRAELEAGLAADPYGVRLHTEYARFLMGERDFAGMECAAARALGLDPSSDDARTLHAWAAWAVEHPGVAARDLERNPIQKFLYTGKTKKRANESR